MTESAVAEPATRPRIVIIGGGIAGLSAALALSSPPLRGEHSTDCHVTLIESRSRPGGRAGSFAEPISGETVDYCQHVAMGCCTNLLDVLHETELIEHFTRYDDLHFYHPGSGISPFRASRWLPAPLHLQPALAGLNYLSGKQQRQIRLGIWRLMRATPAVIAKIDAATWLAENGQDDEVRTKFWDVILVSALGDIPERVSMAAARKVIIDGFAAARGASDVWVPNRELSEIFGVGMTQRLRDRGVLVRTGATVRDIRRPDAGGYAQVAGVVLGDGETVPADHIVIATNWRSASRLLSSLGGQGSSPVLESWSRGLVATLSSIELSPITGLHLWFDREITSHPHVVMVGTTAQWLFRDPVRERADQVAGCYYQVVISGQHAWSHAPRNGLVEQVAGELRAAFPAASDARLLHSRIVTDPAAVYRLSPELDARRPPASTPLKWLHLAGDYVQTGWPATMEGAVISGRLAAESILSRQRDTSPLASLVLPGLRPGWLARRLIRPIW
ncbi:hydroxysqualene dehydroxylase HpnE [Allorhodopirellula heiligendammensis]|uniref:15-cis-phytoene desaturase n=1 Tax=Allorhodopirellula heiligendammensis TaxID=2714739 RepID=A0A5C6BVD0_9BACT|nr:hydroxysqualene dehydroxylase HpnE [Allorhodopirellula heiligendammensis]TWU16018.1 15-cis-phytoene desaturase [Allorhodopirellula heiligendammensis]